MAVVLLVAGFVTAVLYARRSRSLAATTRAPAPLVASLSSQLPSFAAIEQEAQAAMNEFGPWKLIAFTLAAGFLAGRRVRSDPRELLQMIRRR
jgi:hypothetical protein